MKEKNLNRSDKRVIDLLLWQSEIGCTNAETGYLLHTKDKQASGASEPSINEVRKIWVQFSLPLS